MFRRGDEAEYRDALSQYFDLEGRFRAVTIRTVRGDEESAKGEGMEYALINRLRRFKTIHGLTASTKFGLIKLDDYQLLVMNNVERDRLPELLGIITQVYGDAATAGGLFMGAGIEVQGLAGLNRSYQRAMTAMRMAEYRGVPYVRFEDMGVYKILFSVKDEEVLYAYADELLAPLEGPREEEYLELLQSYIHNDRSLERTAEELYLHRNTVNYRLQKLKTLLGSPLKTVEDLFPYQVALAIRDMERRFRRRD